MPGISTSGLMEVRKAKRFRYSKWAIAAMIGGVVLTAIEVVAAVSYLVQEDSPSYLIAGGAVSNVVRIR